MTLDDILARLEGVRRQGDLRAMAKCPAHDDSKPSLSLKELPDGVIVFKCFGGCENLDICKALGIEFSDLFPGGKIRRVDFTERRTGLSPTDRLTLIEHEVGVVLFIANDFLQEHGTMTDERLQRLALSLARIGSAALE